uniref:peptide chain release factor N(5)-glutamine methyltransferase n=1 Tax=Callorhinchus milii TaxID=7868 RepID=A0A4W3JN83_CALMI|eukprot:gi/632946327/ref/XP_007888504.1/ PREDICTED: hemK methyltransferase family member 1 isoform X1 [Callorhinchus milii]
MRGRYLWSRLVPGSCLRPAPHARGWTPIPVGGVGVLAGFSPARAQGSSGHELTTAAQCVTYWSTRFHREGIPEPQESSQYIISHVLGGKTIHSLEEGSLSRALTAEQKRMIWKLCFRRLQRMPVQFVIEEWDFCDLTLKMKPPVFIPRPETEDLVSIVLSKEDDSTEETPWQSSLQTDARYLFLEIGCGSGAITMCLLQHFKQSHAVAVDKSAEAVALTRENAERLCVQHRVREYQLDVISDSQELATVCGPVDAIVSNPPYVFHEDMSELAAEILRYEDLSALDGGTEGMDVIRAILQLAPTVLKHHGKVFLEVEPRHPEMIQAWLQNQPAPGLTYRATHKDHCGKPRFCILQKC